MRSLSKRATYLENLDIFDAVLSAPMMVYTCPLLDDGHDVIYAKGGQTQVMPWMETDDIASTLDRLGGQQGMGGSGGSGTRWWENGSIVVLEYHGGCVVLVDRTVRAGVPRTEIAALIMAGEIGRCGGLRLTKPRTLRAVRRDEDVCVAEGVVCGE